MYTAQDYLRDRFRMHQARQASRRCSLNGPCGTQYHGRNGGGWCFYCQVCNPWIVRGSNDKASANGRGFSFVEVARIELACNTRSDADLRRV